MDISLLVTQTKWTSSQHISFYWKKIHLQSFQTKWSPKQNGHPNCSPSTRPSEDVLKSKRQVKNNLYQFDKKRCLRYVLICLLSGHVDDNKTYIALTYFPGLLLEKHIPRTSLKEQVSNHCFRHLAMDDIKVNRIL